MDQPLVLRILKRSFLKIPILKNSPPGGYFLSPYGGGIVPTHTKITHYLTIAIMNKYFKFQIDWLRS